MSKFEIEFELQGLKLKVKGEREDISKITESLNQQLSGLLPSSELADGNSDHRDNFLDAKNVTPISPPKPQRRKKPQRNSSTGSSSTDSLQTGEQVKALDWRHSPEKWGNPKQDWTTADKALWLLYVVQNELQVLEVSSKQISETFNKHFRQFGVIRTHNVTRDLGKKRKSPAEVGQDTTKPDEPWFLTETGKRVAETLVKTALGATES